MAAPKAAEHEVKNCHRCNKTFQPQDVRIPAFREGRYWYECLECFEELGGVTWAKYTVRYTRND